MWLKTVAAVSAVVLFGMAFGQARPDQPANAGRYYIPVWGRVVAYNGAPIRNGTLVLSGTGRENIKTQTDQDGRFRFPSVEGNKPASLQVDATSIPPVDIGVMTQGGDIGTIVLQPLGRTPLIERFHPTTGSSQPLLSGRITDANGAPMARKDLFFSNRRTGFFLRMDENGAFVCPPASHNEYEIYVSESAFPFAPDLKLNYVGNIAISDGLDIDLGNIVLLKSASSKKGQWGDIAGPVMGHIAGPVKTRPFTPTSEPKVRSSVDREAAIAGVFCGADPATVIQEDGRMVRQPKDKLIAWTGAVAALSTGTRGSLAEYGASAEHACRLPRCSSTSTKARP